MKALWLLLVLLVLLGLAALVAPSARAQQFETLTVENNFIIPCNEQWQTETFPIPAGAKVYGGHLDAGSNSSWFDAMVTTDNSTVVDSHRATKDEDWDSIDTDRFTAPFYEVSYNNTIIVGGWCGGTSNPANSYLIINAAIKIGE